ncbi:hypothetical protein H4R35_004424 [Dimargaris xerosporica]|nr:hypothetical protein H4R35_004424 [Dimargaris xerosporica]
MLTDLKGKTVFITGASAGIGEACAKAFAAAHCNVVITARRVERLEALRDQLCAAHPSIYVHTTALDVSNKDQVNRVIAELPEPVAEVDILINNAGLALGLKPFDELAVEDIETMINTNVNGLIYCTHAFIPRMKAQAKRRGTAIGGHIVNISSIAGHHVYPFGNIYCATKHAVKALTQGLRLDLAGEPVKVSAISPGSVETEFSMVRFGGDKAAADKVYEGMDPLTAQDIADIALFMTSRPAHVDVADVVVYPHAQGGPGHVKRSTAL